MYTTTTVATPNQLFEKENCVRKESDETLRDNITATQKINASNMEID